MMTQYTKIYEHLRRNRAATIGELNKAAGSNWVHSRIIEMTDRNGWVHLTDSAGNAFQPGARIVKDWATVNGRKVRLYRMVRG